MSLAQTLFDTPSAAEARRHWIAAPDSPPAFQFTHTTQDQRQVLECSMQAICAGEGDAPVYASIFRPAGAGGLRSTDMLSNRRARGLLLKRLEAAINAGAPAATMAFGIDNLSELNQVYGFDAADSILSEVAARLRASAEREAGGAATVRHLSGSKFGLVAPGLDSAAARRLALEAQNAVAGAPIRTGVGGVATTVSVGVAVRDHAACDTPAAIRDQAGEMMARALDGLAAARREGPSALREAELEEDAETLLDERRRIARETLMALDQGRVAVAFQPIVASGSRRPAFHECLARLCAPDGSIMPAGAFVPVIERLGQVRLLDRRMLDAVFDALEDAPRARLSLNVSPQTLRDSEWLALYHRRATGAPRAAARMIVEITESSASGDPAATAEFIAAVRAHGAAIALDDFGAGYTAFRQLRDFRFDFLKIDGSFAAGVAADPDNRLFVRTMVDIARHFDMATVAEFVETEEEAEALTQLSVTYQQGYLHGAPSMELMGAASTAQSVMTA